ncbi:MAG: M14 family metallopeptidase [Candidatus Aminicenantes bacterium]|nr:M14 family metallopeptidase [Candidatus Aminicenantes bacterium]
MSPSRTTTVRLTILCVGVLAATMFSQPAQVPAQTPPPAKPLTVAEATNYAATSRYADVVNFILEVQKLSPFLRVETLCRSAEGRDVPLLIIGNPVPVSPIEPRAAKKVVIYIQANIHAGEVEGKEASLMMVRDILLQAKPPYLDRLVLLVAPIFNADGNEKINPNNRRQQPGPEQGVGIRTNGQNLDLNRDAIKLESYEVAGLVQNVLNRWDPLLLIDCHTTDGAWHEQTVTYSWPINPNGDQALIEFQRSKMMPEIEKIMKNKYKTLALGYGGFRDARAPEKGWETLDPQPRYITNYIGVRNRLGILDENYVHGDFKTRVAGNYALLFGTLDYCYAHAEELTKMIAETDARTVARGLAPKPTDAFGVEFDLKALPNPITVLGFEMETVPPPQPGAPVPPGPPIPRLKPTDKKKTYVIPYFADFFFKRTVPFPAGYLIPKAAPEVVQKLRQHGLLVERLTQPVTLEVDQFKMKEVKGAERLYQGHRTNAVKGDYGRAQVEFLAGTIFVTTAQPLANLAAYLLEPESDDGLIVWNYFDKDLASGGFGGGPAGFPVFKLMKPAALAKETIK